MKDEMTTITDNVVFVFAEQVDNIITPVSFN